MICSRPHNTRTWHRSFASESSIIFLLSEEERGKGQKGGRGGETGEGGGVNREKDKRREVLDSKYAVNKYF